MSTIKNGGLDQYGAGPPEQQRFGTADIERVNASDVNSCNGESFHDHCVLLRLLLFLPIIFMPSGV